MISYETAKKLKGARFPQTGRSHKMIPKFTKEEAEILKNTIHNKVFSFRSKFPWKPKYIDYITLEESLWIAAQYDFAESIRPLIDEIIESFTEKK